MSNAVGIALQRALAGLVAGRVYPVVLPDAPVYPCIRYTQVATNFVNALCGPSNLTEQRYRLDVFATSAMECGQVAASILSVMRGGSLGFKNLPASNSDGYEPTVGIYRRMLDFDIWEAEVLTRREYERRSNSRDPRRTNDAA